MKRAEDRVSLPKLLGVSLRRSSHKGHRNQVPLFRSKSELVIPSDYSLETDAEPLRPRDQSP